MRDTTALSPANAPAPAAPSEDGLELLTGPGAGAMLDAALEAAGARVVSWKARDVTHHPGRSATVSYRAKVRWRTGGVTTETLAACSPNPPEGTLVLDDGIRRVGVWRFPFDPELPGLAAANDPVAVGSLLEELGLGGGPVRLGVRAYRPRRRAVVEAVGPRGRLFIKVVRPDRVEPLHQRHRLLVSAGIPAPQSLGWTGDRLLVLQALPGRTMRAALRNRGNPLPTAGAVVVAMLDRLPVEIAEGSPRPSWLERVGHYGAVVGAALPDQAERIATVASAVAVEAGTGPIVPVHGDLYESQLLVDGGRICGVLDVDTARAGDRLDDLGCLLGHLSVLAQLDRPRAGAINLLGARYLAAFDRLVDPADLRYRTASVVVSLATGPHRVQQPGWPATTRRLIGVAEQWLASARTARPGG